MVIPDFQSTINFTAENLFGWRSILARRPRQYSQEIIEAIESHLLSGRSLISWIKGNRFGVTEACARYIVRRHPQLISAQLHGLKKRAQTPKPRNIEPDERLQIGRALARRINECSTVTQIRYWVHNYRETIVQVDEARTCLIMALKRAKSRIPFYANDIEEIIEEIIDAV